MRYTNEDNNKDRNRFKLLLEYDFYIGEDEEENLEVDGDMITEEPPEEGGEEDFDAEPTDGGGEEGGDEDMEAEPEGGDEGGFGGEELPEPEAMDEPLPEPEAMDEPLPEPEPMEDEVELDVTELVQGTDAAKNSADEANAKVSALLAKFDGLQASLDKMAAMNAKIDKLEHEVEKRNPTPQERLEMRSLDSFPYSLKLTDYWSEKEGNYDAMKQQKDGKEEYVLTQDEVDQDYNPMEIKDSFDNGHDYTNHNIY